MTHFVHKKLKKCSKWISNCFHKPRSSGAKLRRKISLNRKNYFLRELTDIEFSIKSNVVRVKARPDPGEKNDGANFPIILHSNDNKENTNFSSDENIIEIDFSICHGEIIEFCHY